MKNLLPLFAISLLLASCGMQNDTAATPIAANADKQVESTPDNIDEESGESMEQEASESESEKMSETTKTDTTVKTEVTTPTANPSNTSATAYTATEVAAHNSASDCWLILDSKVYDVTKFIPSHPGGKAIIKGCGRDATRMFAGHPESAKAMKEKFYIGDLK